MLKMAILLAPLFFLCVSVAGQEMFQISSLNNQDSNTLGVSVDQEKVNEVSTSILMAENWLKTHVLFQYPSTNITSIVVSNNLLCDENEKDSKNISKLVLFAMNNIYHSLIRWGLEKNIKVSIFLTPKCLQKPYLENIFIFLKNINSTYTVKNAQKTNPTRKLSFTVRSSEISYSIPSDAASAPLPPLIGVLSPSPQPETQPPMVNAAPPHYGLSLPPCNPYHNSHHGGATATPPVVGNAGGIAAPPPLGREKLWCVAKPSVPAEQLQEAMDYACGDSGVDCGPISPTGNCYFPDTIVAHASYAFNSYWQKNKKKGGTCAFGGTAMLISSDPSFLHCKFIVA